jgi:hypothetical protein
MVVEALQTKVDQYLINRSGWTHDFRMNKFKRAGNGWKLGSYGKAAMCCVVDAKRIASKTERVSYMVNMSPGREGD